MVRFATLTWAVGAIFWLVAAVFAPAQHSAATIIVDLFLTILYGYAIYRMHMGANIARIVLTVAAPVTEIVLGVTISVLHNGKAVLVTLSTMKTGTLDVNASLQISLLAITMALVLAGTALMYHKESRDWFA